MGTKRMRRGHATALSADTLLMLGLGTGISSIPDTELRALWLEYGERVSASWQRRFGREPFVAWIARQEGW